MITVVSWGQWYVQLREIIYFTVTMMVNILVNIGLKSAQAVN